MGCQLRQEFPVQSGQLAPVQLRVVVMFKVVADVEVQEIEELPGVGGRVAIGLRLRLGDGVNVL